MPDDSYLPGWTAVQRNVYKNYDLENAPLQIRTDSVVGSGDELSVSFLNGEENEAGRVVLFFEPTPKYHLIWCTASNTDFPTDLPSETVKIWKVTLSKTSNVRLQIKCNNKEVLNLVLSDATCFSGEWSTYWGRDVEQLMFRSSDTASDYYRAGKFMNYDNIPTHFDREVHAIQI